MKMNGIRRALTRLSMLIGCTLVVLGCGLSADVAPATSTSSQLTPSITTGATQVPQTTAKSIIQRIQFQPGTTSTTVTGHVIPNGADYWVVKAQAGQTLSVKLALSSGKASVNVSGADGDLLKFAQTTFTSFDGKLQTSQDYNIIVVWNEGAVADYSLTLSIQ